MMLAGTASAQQAPAPKPQPAPVAKAQQRAPAAKTGQAATPGGRNSLALRTPKEKVSYALGMNMGKGMRQDEVDIDTNIFARGLKDALTGGKSLLTDEEAKAAILALQGELRAKFEAKMQQVGEANKKEGEAFLAANKTKEGVVALPSGLQYKILKEGTGPKPSAGDSVVCNYRGMLLNNKEFDNSYKRGQPATIALSGIIKGWTEALQLMPVGSKWQLFVPPELGFGPRGSGRDVGPNATLIFELELLSIQEKGQDQKK